MIAITDDTESDVAAKAELELWRTLLSELQEAGQLVSEKDTQFRRRALVRALFASVEAFVASIRRIALRSPEKFTPEELTLLRQEVPFLEKGKVKRRPQKVSLRDSFPFAFGSYMKVLGADRRLEIDVEWDNFLVCIRVRDRITHPKTAGDFAVGDADLERINRITKWIIHEAVSGLAEQIPKPLLIAGLILIAVLALTRDKNQPLGNEPIVAT